MKIDLVSDLHLDFGGANELMNSWEANSDILIMAGDIVEIATFKNNESTRQKSIHQFFTFISKKYKNVYWVFGNHEHYRGIINFNVNNARRVLKELNIANIVVMNNNIISLENILLFGTTLWTSMNNSNPLTMSVCAGAMNDYNQINKTDVWLETKIITVEDTIQLHKCAITALESFIELKPHPYQKKIVVTHHAPCWLSVDDDYKNDPATPAYVTELSEMIFDSDINLWCHGHIHSPVEYNLNDCKVVCNPMGYVSDKDHNSFCVKTVEI